MPKKRTSFRNWQLKKLAQPKRASSYLQAALEEGPEQFLIALGKVAQARQMSQVAADSGIQRESLYRCLSEQGNPTFSTLNAVLKAVGLQLAIVEAQDTESIPETSKKGLTILGTEEPFDTGSTFVYEVIYGHIWNGQSGNVINRVPTGEVVHSVKVRTQPIGPLAVQVPFLSQQALSIQPTRSIGDENGVN
jgi:probable addiction module antidote protein